MNKKCCHCMVRDAEPSFVRCEPCMVRDMTAEVRWIYRKLECLSIAVDGLRLEIMKAKGE